MPRESKYTAIILKKQSYKEGDEIITIFTKEAGKIRCLAKGIKKPLSKLQQRLQTLFLVNVTLAGGDMPKIIHVEPLKVFSKMRENLTASKTAFYALELVLKFTADEQKNEALFDLLEQFLEFLNSESSDEAVNMALAKFKIEVLSASGLEISQVAAKSPDDKTFFSPGKGGFSNQRFSDALPVSAGCYADFLFLNQCGFKDLKTVRDYNQINELQSLLSLFIEYQLERKIKSEKYL
jgi:DNA repair protein RecO